MFPLGVIGMFWVAAVALAIVFVAVRIAHNGRAVESMGQVLYDTEHPEKRR